MQRTLALVGLSVAISIAISLLVTTIVKMAPRFMPRTEEIGDGVEEVEP
jgi:hypothetical protein